MYEKTWYTRFLSKSIYPVVLRQSQPRPSAEAGIIEKSICSSLSIPARVDLDGLHLLPNSVILQKQYFHVFLMKVLSFLKKKKIIVLAEDKGSLSSARTISVGIRL